MKAFNRRGKKDVRNGFKNPKNKLPIIKEITVEEFLIIASNPSKWVGNYGQIGELYFVNKRFNHTADGRKIARALNSNKGLLISSYNRHYYVYNDILFVGDWVRLANSVYYSKELGCIYDTYYRCWYTKKASKIILKSASKGKKLKKLVDLVLG